MKNIEKFIRLINRLKDCLAEQHKAEDKITGGYTPIDAGKQKITDLKKVESELKAEMLSFFDIDDKLSLNKEQATIITESILESYHSMCQKCKSTDFQFYGSLLVDRILIAITSLAQDNGDRKALFEYIQKNLNNNGTSDEKGVEKTSTGRIAD